MPSLSATAPPMSGATALRSCSPAVRRWKVVHAVEVLPPVLTLATAQADAGMFPSLLTAAGWLRPGAHAPNLPAPPTLVGEWREVRRWRSLLRKEDVRHAADVLHAHGLAAAIAALRSDITVVYDVGFPVGSGPEARPGPCALRSLAVAESMALRRASAVVVHARAMWNWALRKGVRAEELFLIPEPVALPAINDTDAEFACGLPTSVRSGQMWGTSVSSVIFFAPAVGDAPSLELLLRAFAILAGEVEGAHLLIEATPELRSTLAQRAAAAEVRASVRAIAPDEREAAWASSAVVIAADSRHREEPSTAAVGAFAHGRALLAADVAANREVTQNGRGCLWYRPDSARDLAFRAAFLARNPDLRAALGRAGRAHLEATRGARTVAEAYDEVYAHALARHGSGSHPGFLAEAPALQLG